MSRGARRAAVRGVAQSQAGPSEEPAATEPT